MSDSNDYSTDEDPVQEAMAIDSDISDDRVEEAQVVLEDDDDDDASHDTQEQSRALVSTNESSVDASAAHADGDDTIHHDSDSTADHDDDDDDEEDAVAAAVVLEDDADDEMEDVAQAVVVEDMDNGDDHADEQAIADAVEVEGSAKPKSKTPRKTKKKRKKPSKRRRAQQNAWGGVAPERLDAAAAARDVLLNSVPRLPAALSDNHVVRSFGRLCVHDSLESPFATAASLYPVGFSCDRFEFSPTHGRVLKLRCTILDGSKVKGEGGGSPKPIFRVMWGQGVDDDSDDVDYPYDPYTSSFPIADGDNADAVAMSFSNDSSSPTLLPEVGMRVKVRFSEDEWYGGTIVHVGDEESEKKSKETHVEICVQYDDGSTEDATFPDPDIKLNIPGEEDDIAPGGVATLTEFHGKPVTAVTGDTPIAAWGKALLELGLIDEIIFESAIKALAVSREEGRAEAAEKMKELKLQRKHARAKNDAKPSQEDDGEEQVVAMDSSPKSQTSDGVVSPVPSNKSEDVIEKEDNSGKEEGVDQQEDENQQENGDQQENEKTEAETPEEATDEEKALRVKIEGVRAELENLQGQNREALITLTDARIKKLSRLFCNPFRDDDPATTQHWLSTVIRKEKTKMGSTGNKKKVVTLTDLLERNDTFYGGDIERLLEGLPGSEYCPSYVFQEFRSGSGVGLSQAWVHEAEIRQEKRRKKLLKSAREAEAKASQQLEREIKKRKREEDRDARKRQKVEEAEEKKKARVEDRMARLSVQIDERLFKEACFQRERVVSALSRVLGKEFARRRKAAELVSENIVINAKTKKKSQSPLHFEDFNGARELPPLSRTYDEEILRVWDFISSFGSAFTTLGFMSALPSLDSLQNAVDSLREDSSQSNQAKAAAVVSLIDLSVALSKPLAASLTKLLFASLIALNPGLQKDYGASFFADINATSKDSMISNKENGEKSPRGLLPVNKMTWQEVARVAFLSDTLGELGYSRQETAHLLRGYRSGGHPNSKEAKRLRRTEDFSIALLRQIIAQSAETPQAKCDSTILSGKGDYNIRVPVPCMPSCFPSEWTFYLHNVTALPSSDTATIRANIHKALALLKSNANVASIDSITSDLNKSLVLLEKEGKQADSSSAEAKLVVLEVLDRIAGESHSTDVLGRVTYRDSLDFKTEKSEELAQALCSTIKLSRHRMGLLKSIALTSDQYKDLANAREEYMADALRLKEDMDMKEKTEDDDDDDDDDEDEIDEDMGDENETKLSSDKSKAATEEDAETDQTAAKKQGACDSAKEATDNENHERRKVPTEVPATDPRTSLSKGSSDEIVATVVKNRDRDTSLVTAVEAEKVGKSTEFDDFCEDIPGAPELIRRCLAVLRTLCQTGPAEPFIYPVDPQGYPGYYEALIKPMCLREVGRILQNSSKNADPVEEVVAQFGRNVRLINQNCSCYSNVGAAIISSAEEMLRIFERLFLEWVLAPEDMLPPLERLDDDRCVEYHPSDEDSLVLLCDGCEGKYNMSRLDPPLLAVPKGDWFCPRCLSGRCFEDLDPRIGRKLSMNSANQEDIGFTGVIQRSMFRYPEGPEGKPSLMYVVASDNDVQEVWTLEDIDKALSRTGKPVAAVRCLEAVAESPGYSRGSDRGVYADIIPAPLNPGVSDAAAQAISSSAVLRDTVAAASSLLLMDPEEMSASEWSRLLILLTMKCASSEMMLGLASTMESDAAQDMSAKLSEIGKISGVAEILSDITEIEDGREAEDDSIASVQNLDVEHSGETNAGDDGPVDNPVVVDVGCSDAVIVEANGVEIVAEEDAVPNSGSDEPMGATVVVADAVKVVSKSDVSEDLRKKERDAALVEKESRHKVREDSIAAHCIKNQLRSVVASFEEDAVSQVVDSSMTSTDAGLSFPSCRCRGTICHFCGLSDVALGTPLLRVPDDQQWNDVMPHAFRSRRMHLVADFWNHRKTQETDQSEAVGVMGSPSRARRKRKLVIVSLRVGGEIVSRKDTSGYFRSITDGEMLQYLPRNEEGFQMELQFRLAAGLPFTSGSLSAHECCAVAAHQARKEQVVQLYKENRSLLVERDCGMACGRTLSLGTDEMGRSYWKFNSDTSSLFVCLSNYESFPAASSRKWHRYASPEDIASVIVSLGKQEIAREIKRTYPESASMIRNGKWSELLQMRVFPLGGSGSRVVSKGTNFSSCIATMASNGPIPEANSDIDEEPYEEGEDVLVESISGKLLWDATVIGVSKSRAEDKVNGYRVHYNGWSSRFDEWVQPVRVVEVCENNLQVQEELLEELSTFKNHVPPSLEKMLALGFLNKRDRLRGPCEPPNFMNAARVGPGASSNDKIFATLKAAILLVESSLPLGAVDNSDSGPWRPSLASEWRTNVHNARGPSSLMRCVILLEDALAPEWVDDDVGHMLSCMPIGWKAIGEASTASLALRVFLIDKGIKYGVVDKQKFSSRRKK